MLKSQQGKMTGQNISIADEKIAKREAEKKHH